jgi:hypothetical protein
MRIKVGNQWFECAPSQPIAVELTSRDRLNIANMADSATRYACFHADDDQPVESKIAWMAE